MKSNARFLILVAAAAFSLPLRADTEWIVTPKASASGRMMLHANREIPPKKAPPAGMSYDRPGKGKYGFLRIGDRNGGCFAGINDRGLAAAYTTGDPSDDRNPPPSKFNWTAHAAVVISLRESATAEQARRRIHDAFKKRLVSGSMVVFLADPFHAVVIECSPAHYASWDLKEGYCVYSHQWKLPGMDDGSVRSAGSAAICSLREWGVREGLRRRRDGSGGTISAAASIAVSRLNTRDLNTEEFRAKRGKAPVQYAPHGPRAQDSYLFELDPEFPGLLSCVYVAFGPARHTVYLPLAIPALKSLPAEVRSAELLDRALERNRSVDPQLPVDPAITALEEKFRAEFEHARDEARRLALNDRLPAAEKLLADLAKRQAAEAAEFLRAAQTVK